MSKDLAGQAELPRTLNLDSTLRRAHRIAEDRSHRYVTFEHLLLALLDDPEAFNLLSASGADVQSIRSAIADAVNSRMGFLIT
ncbi:MAG TPA: Clp protease N-terminal domain-containing protein, partial [Hyphomicrobiales bacterium]|nr:Clp protease N-terminal domain-containing protein [Hyphomicrobiales bacterium]